MLVKGGVLFEDGCSGEAEHLGTAEEVVDPFVGVAKLGAVRSWAALKLVRVLPLPVVCQI